MCDMILCNSGALVRRAFRRLSLNWIDLQDSEELSSENMQEAFNMCICCIGLVYFNSQVIIIFDSAGIQANAAAQATVSHVFELEAWPLVTICHCVVTVWSPCGHCRDCNPVGVELTCN